MTRKTKGRAGCNQATPKTSKHNRNFTGLAACVKSFIVTLTFMGWLPVGLAYTLNNLGEVRDE